MKKWMFYFAFFASLWTNKTTLSQAIDLVPGGENIGIEIRPDGLIISGTYDIKTDYGTYNPSRDSDIKRGDILYEVEGTHISDLSEFSHVFQQETQQKDEIQVSLKREQKKIQRKLRLIKEENRYRTGLYIKERLIGIGTVSFYDPETHIFGALGHSIVDSDTGNLVEVKSGAIYESSVKGINPSTNGDPGEKVATFSEDHPLGDLMENTTIGIYGTYDQLPDGAKAIPMALHDEVELGKAEIYTVVSGMKVEKFSIEITNLVRQSKTDVKGITFKVTDKTLLEKTGGIVAGMSGSPMIQNGKLIGAVTHVLVDKVQYGYGIYMEWMWQEAQQLALQTT